MIASQIHTELVLLPVLKARRGPNGGLILTRKYLDGVAAYARTWPGPVTSLLALREGSSWEMDEIEVMDEAGLQAIEIRPDEPSALQRRLQDAALAFPFLSPSERGTLRLCRETGVPVVFGSEYTLRTEKQIIDTNTRNPLLRWRRKHWATWAENVRLNMLVDAAGVQCSGTPTFDTYRHHNENALLFFDNRVPASQIINQQALQARLMALSSGQPLRLVFGGRLIPMKGVMDLPDVAAELTRLGIDYRMDIFGHGDLQEQLQRKISALGLSAWVQLGGVLDFKEEWLPRLREHSDLFVCCHPQGDPSSTYIEVMSCGVPIAGYGNEAFAGIARESGTGWVSTLRDPTALAQTIAELAKERTQLAEASQRAAQFAREHAFELTYSRRVDHLVKCSRLSVTIKERYYSTSPTINIR